jgi:hypothetical protein
MKRLLALVLVLLVSSSGSFAQTKEKTNELLEAQIIKLDKSGWEAWKNNDPSWFEQNTTDNFKSISSGGISSKADVVRAIPTDCNVAAYSLFDFSFTVLDENAVLLTYKATQDAVCGGVQAPATLMVAVNFVKRGGRWLEAMYMQAP